ncbi:MAG TPA: extracellular solute-binding protein [Chloroflexota bacterium]|nr:extracellular solute-binding protein [Chloroflexota bacterium]
MERNKSENLPRLSRQQFVRGGVGLIAAVSLPLLAACGGNATPTSVTQPPATAAEQAGAKPAASGATPASGNGVTLEMWAIGGKPQADILNNKVFPGLYQKHPDVKEIHVQMLSGWQDLFQKLVTALAGNAGPDMSRIKDYWTPEFAVKGVLLPLDSYLSQQTDITSDKYGAARWDSTQWKGKVYALPFTTFVEDYFYNETLFNQDGLKPAQTWDEQTEIAKKLTDASKQQWGYMLYDYGASQSGTWDFIPLLWQAGGDFTNADRTQLTFDSDAGVKALSYQVDLIWKYKVCLPPGASTTNVVENSKIGQWHTGCWVIPTYANTAPNLKYSVDLMPALTDDNRSMIIGGNNVGAFKGTKHPDQAWEALAWIGSADMDLVWNSLAGYLPVRVANWQKSPYTDDPKWKVVVEQAQRKDTRPIPIFVGYEEITDKIGSELQAAYFNKKTPQQALADAQKEGNDLMQKYLKGEG